MIVNTIVNVNVVWCAEVVVVLSGMLLFRVVILVVIIFSVMSLLIVRMVRVRMVDVRRHNNPLSNRINSSVLRGINSSLRSVVRMLNATRTWCAAVWAERSVMILAYPSQRVTNLLIAGRV